MPVDRPKAGICPVLKRVMKKLSLPPLFLLACLTLTGASSLSANTVAVESGQPLRLVELFTSHGCSSCPPADRLLGTMLQEDESLLALEYHVDYWDALVHGGDGSWKDPFSDHRFTERQQAYNTAPLAGRRGVYTPQMIVNGRHVAVGSDARRVRQALRQQDVTAQVQIDLQAVPSAGQGDGGELVITIDPTSAPSASLEAATVSLVRYIDSATTDITAGENTGRQLVNHNVVVDVIALGRADQPGPLQYRVAAPSDGEGCVVMVQDVTLSPLLAAARCP